MKIRRTRKYNSTGKRIYATLNKTSSQQTYSNTEPRFALTCKSRSNGGGKGCTHAGCGSQCCLLSFFVRNISHEDWITDISRIRVGQTLKNSGGGGGTIGTIKEIIFPCACCQVIDLIGNDEFQNFPLDMRILAKPASGSCSNSRYTGGKLNTTQVGDISGNPTVEESYEVLGTSNVGAPYRNPIKGWRKTLDCCLCENYQLTGNFSQPPSTNNLVGSTITIAQSNSFSGIIEGYSHIPGTSSGYSLTIQTINCPPKHIPLVGNQATVSTETGNEFTITATKGLGGRTRLIANDIYKDNYSGPKSSKSGCCPGGARARSGIQGRTHHPIIRSGMQPKPNICCKTGKPATRCNRDPSGCIEKNRYAYDSHQYLHNRSLKSFQRSQDKFFTMYLDDTGTGTVQATLGASCPQLAIGHGCNTITNKPILYSKGTCREGHRCVATVGKYNPTIYKPNNRKFSKQGAATSSGRLERLKLDTIRTSNSKCPKGPDHPRCRTIVGRNGKSTQTFLAPKGPYLAGRPRFTGWMYNARHPERICMLKYRQQPFGIPQLTRRGARQTRSNPLQHSIAETFQQLTMMIATSSAPTWSINAVAFHTTTISVNTPYLWRATVSPGDTIQQWEMPSNIVSGGRPGSDYFYASPPFSGTGYPGSEWMEQPTATGTIVAIITATPATHSRYVIKVLSGGFVNPSGDVKVKRYTTISKADPAKSGFKGYATGPPGFSKSPPTPGVWPSTASTLKIAVETWQEVTPPIIQYSVGERDTVRHTNIGVWQRGNTNPRAPGCKCVSTGSTGCPSANCQTPCGIGQMAINPGNPCCN